MNNLLKKYFLLLMLSGSSTLLFSQTLVAEDKVPLKTMVRFYDAYDGVSMTEWYDMNGSEGINYKVKFSKGEGQYEVTLDKLGKVVTELSEGTDLPAQMAEILHTRYGSYKVKNLKSSINRVEDTAEYFLTMKTKVHGEFNLVMDELFTIKDNKGGVAYEN
ncbi:MAG: hypothetical protein ACI83W_000967 [Marinoscillum sp.]|jgi:hypothetical protein